VASKRGRPVNADNPELAAKDDRIGWAVYELMWYGFPQDKACECVGRLAAKILGRTDSYGLPLSVERIEQLCEAWVKRQRTPLKRSFIARSWLVYSRPKPWTLQEYTRYLLVCGESAPSRLRTQYLDAHECERLQWLKAYWVDGDPELTPGGNASGLWDGPKTG
jgi:hypothetical protein